MDKHFAASRNYKLAWDEYNQARQDYRAGTIDGDAFLLIKERFDCALKLMDATCPLANG